MKLRAPEGCTSMSHAGRLYEVAADGSIEVGQADSLDVFHSHGFTDWVEPPAAPPPAAPEGEGPTDAPGPVVDEFDGMNRNGLFAWLREAGVSVMPPITNDELRVKCREAKKTLEGAGIQVVDEHDGVAGPGAV
jgi:hypothetical protein